MARRAPAARSGRPRRSTASRASWRCWRRSRRSGACGRSRSDTGRPRRLSGRPTPTRGGSRSRRWDRRDVTRRDRFVPLAQTALVAGNRGIVALVSRLYVASVPCRENNQNIPAGRLLP